MKKGQKGQFFKLKILKIKCTFLIQFHLRNPIVYFFVYDVYKWAKNLIHFYDVTTFHTYYSDLGQKLRYEFEIWHANYLHVFARYI